MNTEYRHIAHTYRGIRFSLMQPLALSLLPLLTAVLLLTGCASSDEDSKQHAVLSIYVYTPDNPIPTRSGIDPIGRETEVNSLQIWVFSHEDGRFVGYLNPDVMPTVTEASDGVVGAVYQMLVPDWFTVQKPLVDVYVVANAASLGLSQDFSASTSQEVLENAIMTTPFGVDPATTTIPDGGLPMTGVLREQPVVGDAPTLRIGDYDNMAKVQLTRMVSKVRFVFSCSNEFASLTITKVTLDEAMIPNEEYLFLTNPQYPDPDPDPNLSYTYTGNYYNINTAKGYNTGESPSLVSLDETTHCDDPAYYAWERLTYDKPASTAQDYEDLINAGLQTTYEGESGPRLTECRLYLRESDKRLKGKIYYQQKEKADDSYSSEKYVEFEMAAPDPESSDLRPYYFSRNHTWIVFAYLAWAKMNVVSVTVKPWFTTEFNRTLYNW